MQAYTGEPSVLFVALRDRPCLPAQAVVASESRHSAVKPLHKRKVTTERVRTVRSRRIPIFRTRELSVVVALSFLIWPDVTQRQSPFEYARAIRIDSALQVARLDLADNPRSLKFDLATAFPD